MHQPEKQSKWTHLILYPYMGRVGDVWQELYLVNTDLPTLSTVIELALKCLMPGDQTPF